MSKETKEFYYKYSEQNGGDASDKTPDIPPDFYIKLLKLPPCKIGKPCNDCGKCER